MEILSLGEKIKQKRKEQNMTLKDLSGDKVTPGQISLVESGKSKPSMDLLEYIAVRLGVSIDYILETEEHQAEKLCEYYSKIAEASLLAENFEQTREAINKGMSYARQYNIEYYIGLNEFYKGRIEFGQGMYKEAQSTFISANEVFLKMGKKRDIIQTYIYLGMAAYELYYYDSALNFYKQAERIFKQNKIFDNYTLVKIYYNISLCYSKIDNHSAAIDYLLLSAEKYKEKNDKFQYGQSLLMLSISYKSMGRFDEAIEYASRAISIFEELNNLCFVARVETDMGVILSEIGNLEDSFKHLENAYKIKMENSDKSVIYTMLRIADNYIKLQNPDKAKEIIEDILNKYGEDEIKQYRVSLYYYLYRINLIKDDKKSAELSILEAVKYLQNMEMPKELADAYIILGEYYDNEGNPEEALMFMKKGLDIYKSIGITSFK